MGRAHNGYEEHIEPNTGQQVTSDGQVEQVVSRDTRSGDESDCSRYTTSPGGTPKSTTPPTGMSRSAKVAPSPLQRKHSEVVVMDVRMDEEGELARGELSVRVSLTAVYGSVLDPNIVLPECSACHRTFNQGEKQYEPK